MPLQESHPDLASEQAYISRAYDCMDAMYEGVASLKRAPTSDEFAFAAWEAWKAVRLAALSDHLSALVFGRLDTAEPERFYIGRHHIWGGERETVVVDWRAPVARPFYQASRSDHHGLAMRRRFLVDGKELLGISDDDFAADVDLREDDVLQTELRRQKPGRMRDIVATIQSEQDAIIRSPIEGIVVVQGGPGTGKTAIGLHRASYLLFEHREELAKHKVLVVGPNQVFMHYISQVLPSLGEVAVVQRTLGELAPVLRVRSTDTPRAARVKGDARMAEVIARALALRCGVVTDDVAIPVPARVTLPAADLMAEAERIRAMAVPHKRGRGMLREALLMRIYRLYQARFLPAASPQPFEEIARTARTTAAFTAALDTVWPAVAPTALVGELLTDAEALEAASSGILADDERAAILRRGRTRWSEADKPLIDEATALIDEPADRYGHVVVDEAQDLSPMALRSIARRTRDGSLTVLGDLAQGTEAWAHAAWDEVVEHLPAVPSRHSELTLGYRVAPAIMDLAARVLAEVAPGLRAPRSVRADDGEVHVARTDDLPAAVAGLAPALRTRVDFGAIIAADAMLDELLEACATAGLEVADARVTDLGAPIMAVPASAAKGLEFDGVLLVEPATIVEQGRLNLLYICITRAMRALVIAHTRPLPDAIVGAGS